MRDTSMIGRIVNLPIEGRIWIEAENKESLHRLAANWHTAKVNGPKEHRNVKIKTNIFTAVPSSIKTEVRYLLCIERVA